ncbi:hypothetical protein QM996_01145 [Sinorhizobium chiapasense]
MAKGGRKCDEPMVKPTSTAIKELPDRKPDDPEWMAKKKVWAEKLKPYDLKMNSRKLSEGARWYG